MKMIIIRIQKVFLSEDKLFNYYYLFTKFNLSLLSQIDELDDADYHKNVSMLLNKSNVIASFDCQHIRNDGTLIPG